MAFKECLFALSDCLMKTCGWHLSYHQVMVFIIGVWGGGGGYLHERKNFFFVSESKS